MRAALVFEWRGAISGREEQGLEVLARATETWTKIAAEGRCEVPEVFVGIPKAMFIVRGEDAVLLGSTRLPYWQLNGRGGEKHLKEMGLAIPVRTP